MRPICTEPVYFCVTHWKLLAVPINVHMGAGQGNHGAPPTTGKECEIWDFLILETYKNSCGDKTVAEPSLIHSFVYIGKQGALSIGPLLCGNVCTHVAVPAPSCWGVALLSIRSQVRLSTAACILTIVALGEQHWLVYLYSSIDFHCGVPHSHCSFSYLKCQVSRAGRDTSKCILDYKYVSRYMRWAPKI